MRKKGFLTSHAKSSAALISLGIHAVLLVIAVSFVAVTVITKNDQKFEARSVSRPKMQLKKLQVPVNIKKKPQKPKLRKRIVSRPKMNQSMPDIKMPEITGIKGGLGAGAGGGLGGAGGIGFSMPEIKVFGIKSKGEKIFILLDADPRVMKDEVGGMRAYTIIKDELFRIIADLPSSAVFNVAVFEHNKSFALFPSMVAANSANVAKVKTWLDPLNAVSESMGDKDFGVKTLPPGGTAIPFARYNNKYGKVQRGVHWYPPAALAMEQQADTVFILTGFWGVQDHPTKEKATGWTDAEWKLWDKKVEKARELLKKENEERMARGEPPRVVAENDNSLVNAYFPGTPYPPRKFKQYIYSGRDFAEALHLCREEYAPEVPAKSGLSKKKKDRFSLNVVYFAPADTGIPEHQQERFKQLTSMCKGDLKVLNGLDAIESSVSGGTR